MEHVIGPSISRNLTGSVRNGTCHSEVWIVRCVTVIDHAFDKLRIVCAQVYVVRLVLLDRVISLLSRLPAMETDLETLLAYSLQHLELTAYYHLVQLVRCDRAGNAYVRVLLVR